MKSLKYLLAAALLLQGCSLFATPVLFSNISPGGGINNRRILITADQTPFPPIVGTNNLTGLQFYIQPVNGYVITNLVPWGYTYQPDGWPRSVHIVVTNDTATHNVNDFINPNPFIPITIVTGGVNINSGGSTNGFTGSVTNLASLAIVTNFACTIVGSGGTFVYGVGPYVTLSSNYTVSGSVIADYTYRWNGSQFVGTNFSSIGYGAGWVINSPNFGPQATVTSGLIAPDSQSLSWTGSSWLSGGGVLPWTISGYSLSTNSTLHFNTLTFTNGICLTNIFR